MSWKLALVALYKISMKSPRLVFPSPEIEAVIAFCLMVQEKSFPGHVRVSVQYLLMEEKIYFSSFPPSHGKLVQSGELPGSQEQPLLQCFSSRPRTSQAALSEVHCVVFFF